VAGGTVSVGNVAGLDDNLFADTLGRAVVTEAGENKTVVVERTKVTWS